MEAEIRARRAQRSRQKLLATKSKGAYGFGAQSNRQKVDLGILDSPIYEGEEKEGPESNVEYLTGVMSDNYLDDAADFSRGFDDNMVGPPPTESALLMDYSVTPAAYTVSVSGEKSETASSAISALKLREQLLEQKDVGNKVAPSKPPKPQKLFCDDATHQAYPRAANCDETTSSVASSLRLLRQESYISAIIPPPPPPLDTYPSPPSSRKVSADQTDFSAADALEPSPVECPELPVGHQAVHCAPSAGSVCVGVVPWNFCASKNPPAIEIAASWDGSGVGVMCEDAAPVLRRLRPLSVDLRKQHSRPISVTHSSSIVGALRGTVSADREGTAVRVHSDSNGDEDETGDRNSMLASIRNGGRSKLKKSISSPDGCDSRSSLSLGMLGGSAVSAILARRKHFEENSKWCMSDEDSDSDVSDW